MNAWFTFLKNPSKGWFSKTTFILDFYDFQKITFDLDFYELPRKFVRQHQSMDLVRSYIGTNKPLASWKLYSSLVEWFDSKPDKKWGKKCSTGQKFIRPDLNSYKIHILESALIIKVHCFKMTVRKYWIHSAYPFTLLVPNMGPQTL